MFDWGKSYMLFGPEESLAECQTIEFKEASVCLPDDVWETYSAFANTEGGKIVLGIAEPSPGVFKAEGVGDARTVMRQFWENVRNPQRVENDVMLPDGVSIDCSYGVDLVVVNVPRAERHMRPVRVYDKKMKSFVAFVRRDVIDTRCNDFEMRLLEYDALPAADRRAIEELDISALDGNTIASYRQLFNGNKPGHPWSLESDADFLYRIGALAKDRTGRLCPTLAGLLAFGHEYEIVGHLPYFLLDYRNESSGNARWDDRLTSNSGDWSGNLFDFYFAVMPKIDALLLTPLSVSQDGTSHRFTNDVKDAVHEALANALVHAYYGGQSTVRVIVKDEQIVFENAGSFLVDRNVAIAGGISDPRNPTLMRIFGMVGISDRAGSGLCTIYATWKKKYGSVPRLSESYAPAKVVFELPIDCSVAGDAGIRGTVDEDTLLLLCRKEQGITAEEAAQFFGVLPRAIQKRMKKLESNGVVVHEKKGRSFYYKVRQTEK